MDKISIIVPCFNEQKALPILYKELNKVTESNFNDVEFEYIFVNDGSSDKTLDIIKEFAKSDKRVIYISFSRNFGKEAAMYAGLEASTGDYVTLMDADMQDPPSLLIQMYDIIKNEDYDSVGVRRISRKGEPVIRSFFSHIFYKIIKNMSKTEMVDGARDYRLMTRQMVNAILSMKEYNRYSKGLFNFVGFNTKWLEYENVERVAGKTTWSVWGLFKYAIEGITAFSTMPLVISSFIGILFRIISFIMIILIIVKTLVYGDQTSGWPSLVCIIFFVSGIQLFMFGIMGQYLSKMYLEIKKKTFIYYKGNK